MTIRFNRNENLLKSMSAWTFALQTADQNTLKFYLHFCFSLSSVDSHSALNPLQLLCVNSNATEHWRSNDVSLNKRISNVWNLWNHHYFAFLEEFWSTYQNRGNNVKKFKVWIWCSAFWCSAFCATAEWANSSFFLIIYKPFDLNHIVIFIEY